MIDRGVIEEILSKTEYRVRVPIIHKSKDSLDGTKTHELPVAKCVGLPNYNPNYQVGDNVLVSYERDVSEIIIIGLLYGANKHSQSKADIKLDSLIVTNNTQLGNDTTIGEVTPQELSYLKNLKGNIQGQLNVIEQRIENGEGGGGGGIDPSDLLILDGGDSKIREGE